MRFDDNRPAFECIRNVLKGQFLKSEAKLRTELAKKFDAICEPTKFGRVKNPDAFVPIRSPKYDLMIKPEHKRNWAYKKPKTGKTSKARPPTVDEILASL